MRFGPNKPVLPTAPYQPTPYSLGPVRWQTGQPFGSERIGDRRTRMWATVTSNASMGASVAATKSDELHAAR